MLDEIGLFVRVNEAAAKYAYTEYHLPVFQNIGCLDQIYLPFQMMPHLRFGM